MTTVESTDNSDETGKLLAEDDDRIPVEVALPGLRLHPLEDGDGWDFVFCLVKTHDDAGEAGWAYRTSSAPNMEELLGALIIHTDMLRRELREAWE